MHGATQRVDNREKQLDFFIKTMVGPRTNADHDHQIGN